MADINSLIKKLDEKGLKVSINEERPIFIQPEDRIIYRSTRIVLICGMLNTKNGLSKEVIACIDFLLRNPGYQRQFIIEYFKENKNLKDKLSRYLPKSSIENDFHIIQYKSVPWDLRFNDMFLFLKVRSLISTKGEKPEIRIFLTSRGESYFEALKEIFIDEINFLEIFGRSISEEKAKKIITEVIPNTYWKENEKFNY